MKKRILLTLVCLFMVSLNFKSGLIEAEEEVQYTPEEAFKITTSDTGNYIYQYDVSIGGTDVVIPPTIKGLTVDRIGNQGVFQNKGLTSVVLPNTLKQIGNGAFSGNQLTSIKIPDSVTSIGNSTFANNRLTSLELPNSVIELGSACFANNEISELKLSNKLTAISNTCFQANSLQSVVIPEGVETIGTNAFSANLNLSKVVIANSVKTIGDEAFRQANISDLTLGNSITNIGNLAFSAGLDIQTIQLPETLETIGYSAFSGGILSGTLIIPDSVTSIGYSAFSSNQIENIQFGSGLSVIEESTFSSNRLSTLSIPDNITTIGINAFASQSVYVTMNKYNGKYNFNFSDLLGDENIENLVNIKLSENYNGYGGTYDSENHVVSYSKIPEKNGMAFLSYDYKINDASNLGVKLYFKEDTYQVTFKDAEGKIIESTPYPKGEMPTEPNLENVKIPEDKQFSRWDKAISSVNDEVVYQMVLETKKLNVVFKDDQGNVIQTVPVEYGKDAIPPINVFKEGYTFIDWDTEFNNVTSNLEVKAIFKLLPRAVTKECIIEIGENVDLLDYIEGIDADGLNIKDIEIIQSNLNKDVPGTYEIEFIITDKWEGQTKGILNVVVKEKIKDPDNNEDIDTPNDNENDSHPDNSDEIKDPSDNDDINAPDNKDEIKTEIIENPKDKMIETKDQSGLMFYSLIFILSLSVLVFEINKKSIR